MNAEYIQFLLAVVGIVGAVGTYTYQKRVDRKNSLIDIKRTKYQEFLGSFAELVASRNGHAEVLNYRKKRIEMSLVASDSVSLAVQEFVSSVRENAAVETRKSKCASMLKAMRADGYEPTRLSTEVLSANLPFEFTN